MLTPDALREHANSAATPFWDGQARQMLKWAADILEAATDVIDERAANTSTTPHTENT